MDEIKKMLRTVINNQSVFRQEVMNRIDQMEKRLDGRIDSLETKVDNGFAKVNERIDKLGRQLAFLEDDAPTRDEFDKLEKRVTKVESKHTVA